MNTRRMNRLEELGRVDAEKADTRKGKRNLREEKSRIVRELKAEGGKVSGKRRKMGPPARDKAKGRKGGSSSKKKQGYKDRKDESIAMRIRKPRTARQLKASRDESYGKFGSKAKKSGKINR